MWIISERERRRMPQSHLSGADQPDTLPLAERLQMARAVEGAWCAAWASLGALPYQPRSLVDDAATALRVVTPGLPATLMYLDLAQWNPSYSPAPPPGVSYRRLAPDLSDHGRPDALRIISEVFDV